MFGMQDILKQFCSILNCKVLHVNVHIRIPSLGEICALVHRADSWDHLYKLNWFHIVTHRQNLNNLHGVVVAASNLFRTFTSVDRQLTLTGNKVFFSAELCDKWLNSVAEVLIDSIGFNVISFDFVDNWGEFLEIDLFSLDNKVILAFLQSPNRGINGIPIWFIEHILFTWNTSNNLVECFFTICSKQTDCSEFKHLWFSVKFN